MSETQSAAGLEPEDRRAIVKWIVQAVFGLAGYAMIISLTAGALDWVWGWVLVAVLGAVLATHPLLLIPINPDLLVERGKGIFDEGVKSWDRAVSMFAAGLFPMAGWIVAGLDYRLGWTRPLSLAWHLGGLLGMVLGFVLFMWAMVANAFFAEGVRIQRERGHTVATRGPYRFVRHPGYLGAIIAELATPVLLGSVWALIPAVGSAAMYVLRTFLEDRTLQAELEGYSEYAGRTRFRLLPGVW
jgi:protein-S-isoprenylcysteine O-methyltransferase Ste14